MAQTRSRKSPSMADRLLEDMHRTRGAVSIYLVSGFQLKGEIVEFDAEAILLKVKEAHQLVMRSAVASMYPLAASKTGDDGWWRSYSPESP